MSDSKTINQQENNSTDKPTTVLNVINSIEEEYQFILAYWQEFYEMSHNVVREYMNSYNVEYKKYLSSSNSMFSDLQHYLLLVNPEITLICERYNHFLSIKNDFDSLIIDRNEPLKSFFSKNYDLIKSKIEEQSHYFEQFKELYEEHIENWQLLVDINSTEKQFGYWALFTSAMQLYQDKVKLVLTPRIYSVMDKMQKRLISVEELQYSQDYHEIKCFIADVRANKEYLMTEVPKILRVHFNEVNKKKLDKLISVHRVYIDKINELYERKYTNISTKDDVHSSLTYLENMIKMLKENKN